MRMFRKYILERFRRRNPWSSNSGMALLELILAISVGVLVTTAATTVLLLCLRVYNTSTRSAQRQGQVLTAVTTVENLVADSPDIGVNAAGDQILSGTSVLVKKEGSTLVNGSGGKILEDVESFTAVMEGSSLLNVTMQVRGESYTFLVLTDSTSIDPSNTGTSLGVRVFLETLYSQKGTPENENYGFIRENGVSTGVLYAQWYNPAWDANTAWCSCYVSWALEQCRGYISGTTPKYASVNRFMEALSPQNWKNSSYTPNPGDLIFFNWDGGLLDHVGVVTRVENGKVYTIEGNSGGAGNADGYVREKVYTLKNNAYIAGYGVINCIG